MPSLSNLCQSLQDLTQQDRQTLNLGLDIVNSIGGLYLKGDRLTREGLDEDLHGEDLKIKRRQSVPHSLLKLVSRKLLIVVED